MIRVASFDPGIGQPGFAVVDRTALGYRVVEARGITTDAGDSMVVRVGEIWDVLAELLREHCPALLAVEKQYETQAAAFERGEFQASNAKTMVTVGAAIGCGRAYRVPCIEIAPQTVKVALLGKGSRSASKKDVQAGVLRLTGQRLSQAKSDAVAIAVAGAQRAHLLGRVA